MLHNIKQSYMRYYEGRKQQHFPCWWWWSRVLGWTNAQKIIHGIFLAPSIQYVRLMTSFSILLTCPLVYACVRILCTHLVYCRLLRMWSCRLDALHPLLQKFGNFWLDLSSIEVCLRYAPLPDISFRSQ